MFTFLWNQYIERPVRNQKRSASEIERIGNKFLVPRFGDRMANSITRAEITALVEDVCYRNPQKPTPRDRFLSDDGIKVFWRACDKMGSPFGPGFKLLLVTGQRRSEVFGASRAEVNKDGIWTIPGARAKNGIAHIVPLPQLAIDIIDALPKVDGSDKLFSVPDNPDAVSSGFSKGHPRLLRLMGELQDNEPVDHFVLHDLRRTAATGMQRLGVPMPVTEAVLNHISGSHGGIAGV